jgi:hypothetical protein
VELHGQISSFYHTTICWIIGINMHHVAEYQIKNEHICNYFSVPDPIDMLWKRQFNLRGKFARMDSTRLPRKFLTTWVSHPWCSGGQHYTLQNSYVETLQHILPNIPDNGTIDLWLPLAQNCEQWKTLRTEWIKHRQALMIYQYGPHPLLGDGILDHQFFWNLQDIHCRFSMNDGHVWSIFLCSFCYVMILLLFWGHEPCIRFFLWRSNMPEALICYAGSIEKLKLLGATYLEHPQREPSKKLQMLSWRHLQNSTSLRQMQKSISNENMKSDHLRFFAGEAKKQDLPHVQKFVNESSASSLSWNSVQGRIMYAYIQ